MSDNNQEERALTPNEIRENRCVPLAHDFVKLLAQMEKMPCGQKLGEELEKNNPYHEVAQKLMQLMIERGVQVVELNYIYQLMMQSAEVVKGILEATTDEYQKQLEETMYNLPSGDRNYLTFGQLENLIKNKDKFDEKMKEVYNN